MLDGIRSTAFPRAAISPLFSSTEPRRRVGGHRWLPALVLFAVVLLVGTGAYALWPNGPHGSSSSAAATLGAPLASVVLPHGPGVVRPGDGAGAIGATPDGAAATYNVTFTESGLPTGTLWSINVSGTRENSTTNQIVFVLPNGTYSFQIPVVPGYTPTVSSHVVHVKGAAAKVTVKFSVTKYTVTFVEAGLPTKTTWEVTLTPSSGAPNSKKASTSNITFSVPNGNYNYSIGSIGGYQITSGNSTGSLTVAGGNLTALVVGWSKSPSKGGLSPLDYIIIAVVIAGVVIAAVLLILRRRKHRASPQPWTPPAPAGSGSAAAPPSSTPSAPPSGPENPPGQNSPPVKP